nr:amidohydrolase [Acetonema longum]
MSTHENTVQTIYQILHAMPEIGFQEFKTAAYLAEELKAAGFSVKTGFGGTGIVGSYDSGQPGPVIMLRADMDALAHTVHGEEKCIHSCGHDAHSAMVLTAGKVLKETGIPCGQLKLLFQPAEEKLTGALNTIADGALEGVDMVFGIHLRPEQEARINQATPALYHGASYIAEAKIEGLTAHGARPHLGVNAIDAAAAVVQAVNGIRINPVVPCTVKTTKFQAGGATLNAIPDLAELAFDLRAQRNDVMDELIGKLTRAVESAAAGFGAKGTVTIKGGVPAAEYSEEMIAVAREAIQSVLGPTGLLDPIVTPGGEDFHFFVKKYPAIKAGYIGLGCDLKPGLHHPAMSYNLDALPKGVKILVEVVNRALRKYAG